VEKKYIYRRGGRGFDLGRFNGRWTSQLGVPCARVCLSFLRRAPAGQRSKATALSMEMEVSTWRAVIGGRMAGRLELFSWPVRGAVVRVRDVGAGVGLDPPTFANFKFSSVDCCSNVDVPMWHACLW
jgi:hypothetical protein